MGVDEGSGQNVLVGVGGVGAVAQFGGIEWLLVRVSLPGESL